MKGTALLLLSSNVQCQITLTLYQPMTMLSLKLFWGVQDMQSSELVLFTKSSKDTHSYICCDLART